MEGSGGPLCFSSVLSHSTPGAEGTIVRRGCSPTIPCPGTLLPCQKCLWPLSEPSQLFWKPFTLDLGGCLQESKCYLSSLGGGAKKVEASEVISDTQNGLPNKEVTLNPGGKRQRSHPKQSLLVTWESSVDSGRLDCLQLVGCLWSMH